MIVQKLICSDLDMLVHELLWRLKQQQMQHARTLTFYWPYLSLFSPGTIVNGGSRMKWTLRSSSPGSYSILSRRLWGSTPTLRTDSEWNLDLSTWSTPNIIFKFHRHWKSIQRQSALKGWGRGRGRIHLWQNACGAVWKAEKLFYYYSSSKASDLGYSH